MEEVSSDSVLQDAVLGLLTEAMLANVNSSKGFLIDGYPRELEQALTFEKQVSAVTV
jgi:adenylate kinase